MRRKQLSAQLHQLLSVFCWRWSAGLLPQGFLRAFSDNPNAFASGFNRVEKAMKALRVRRLLLFPRFHGTVKDSLEAQPPQVGPT
jgi:hypothetical protein